VCQTNPAVIGIEPTGKGEFKVDGHLGVGQLIHRHLLRVCKVRKRLGPLFMHHYRQKKACKSSFRKALRVVQEALFSF